MTAPVYQPLPANEYERGHAAGEIHARLAGHDVQLVALNGSLTDIARELGGLRMAVQRLADREEARRDRWASVGRLLGGLAATATVLAAAVAAWLAFK